MPGLTNEKPTKRAEHTSRFQPTSGPAPGIYGECRPKSVIGAEPVPVGFSRHPDLRPGFQSGAALLFSWFSPGIYSRAAPGAGCDAFARPLRHPGRIAMRRYTGSFSVPSTLNP